MPGARIFSPEEGGSIQGTARMIVAALQKFAVRDGGTPPGGAAGGPAPARGTELGSKDHGALCRRSRANRLSVSRILCPGGCGCFHVFAIDCLYSSLALACHSIFDLELYWCYFQSG